MEWEGYPYDVTYPMMLLILPTPIPCEQTNACENITFLHLCLRAVTIGVTLQNCHRESILSKYEQLLLLLMI